MRGTISFAVPTAEEECGHRPEKAPIDRIALYRERVERIEALAGAAAFNREIPAEVTIFAEVPERIDVPKIEVPLFEFEDPANPCIRCNGTTFRDYWKMEGRPGRTVKKCRNRRCVACARASSLRYWNRRKVGATG